MFVTVPSRFDPVYTQAYAWLGQYTLASDAVSPVALTTATETAANMLRHRPDIAARLADADSRIAIIPGNETTLLIPEHAPFAPQKGYGGTLGIPVTSVTENNILRLQSPLNAHPTQNITVHEFAHAIENIGFDDALRLELSTAYALAMDGGLWANTYAATNEDEYFAEMSNAYFDHERPPDAFTNFVNTREELAEYDPLGFALLEKVYGNDSWRDGDWAGSQGADMLVGLGNGDFLFGQDGDDTLNGGAGNDVLDGGHGVDRAVFDASSTASTLVLSADGPITVQDRTSGGAGQDTLISMEEVIFGDGRLVDLTAMEGITTLSEPQLSAIVELYIAYFNRAPDANGLYFWGNAYAKGTTLPDMARLFIDQDETRALYPAEMTSAGIATAVYTNVLGRVPDQAGFDFWVGVLNSGAVGRDIFILAVLEGAKAAPPPGATPDFISQQLADRQYLGDKTDIGARFAVTFGMSDVADAVATMALFDGSADSIAAAVAAIDSHYADALAPGAGDFLMPLVGLFNDPFAV
ncbi:DUF4214 domain-containing protein [Marimonas sp. MJW-29]|uniref:DUF4214 domain-containing protein n=1 Tax=Sulfitobacter sediminis TaxID=3234186 RepID=A0ABV3RLS2_9RHOB